MKTSEKPNGKSTATPKSKAIAKVASAADKPKSADKPKASAPAKPPVAKNAREALIASTAEKQAQAPDPMQMLEPKKLAVRVGIPLAIVWIISIVLSGWIPKVVALVVTIAVAALIVWVLRYTRRTQAVANLVRAADTPQARKEAIEKLESEFGKDDSTALFARAQLELQEDPKKALATLEAIKLDKVLPPVADQTRAHRAMIHLVLGETEAAKGLVDKIDLGRHKDAKERAMLVAIMGEAWARTGAAKKAVELLEALDPSDPTFADLKPQLLRSRAFAYAWTNDTKKMKVALRQLAAINAQYLVSFITNKKVPGGMSPKGIHPLLEKEAFDMFRNSGVAQRKMDYRRH